MSSKNRQWEDQGNTDKAFHTYMNNGQCLSPKYNTKGVSVLGAESVNSALKNKNRLWDRCGTCINETNSLLMALW